MNLQGYIRHKASIDEYDIVKVSSCYGRVGNILVRIWIKNGSAEFTRTLNLSVWQYYNHSEEWESIYEEIRLHLLFG